MDNKLTSAPDIPLIVTVPSSSKNGPPQLSAERRINPSWTVSQFKAKLEPVTGIPPSYQELRIRSIDGSWTTIVGDDDRLIGEWNLRRGGEIEVQRLSITICLLLLSLGPFM
ncbi:hypothetical protein HC762_00765 [bacterium]|nr:hypothetical protein [bacterium]